MGESWTDSFEGSIGVATHHDGMSGTERQDVADDYAQRITESGTQVEAGVEKSLQTLLGTDAAFAHCGANAQLGLNMSMCAATTGADAFTVVAWNLQSQAAAEVVRIPVTVSRTQHWFVTDSSGNKLPSQLIALDKRTEARGHDHRRLSRMAG